MRGKGFIKVTSVLFIISGILAIITYTLGTLLLGYATIDTKDNMGWIVVGIALLYTVLSILQFVAGVKGVKGCDKKEATADLRKWGRIVLVIGVITGIVSCVESIMQGEQVIYGVLSIAFALVLPLLYLHGVTLNEQS